MWIDLFLSCQTYRLPFSAFEQVSSRLQPCLFSDSFYFIWAHCVVLVKVAFVCLPLSLLDLVAMNWLSLPCLSSHSVTPSGFGSQSAENEKQDIKGHLWQPVDMERRDKTSAPPMGRSVDSDTVHRVVLAWPNKGTMRHKQSRLQ